MALTKVSYSMITGASSNVLDFGADSTGAASSTSAFTLANSAATGIVIPKGTYLVSTNFTFTVPVTVEYGAVITVPTGITLTFNGGFNAGVYQVFNCTGTGKVTFNPQYTVEGFAEWWGAAGGSGTDSGAAINAAIIALLKVQLMGADYFSSITIKMQLPHRELCGVGYSYADTTDQVTRILVTSGSLDVMLVGPDTMPVSINNFQKQNAIRNLYVSRSVAPIISSVCNGIKLQYTIYTQFENVKSSDSIYGFQFYGAVYAIITNCKSNRAIAGTGGGTDLWYGYYINGFSGIAAGGNASIYLNYCTAGCDVASLQTLSSLSYGFYLNNKFTDAFLESPETVDCAIGINIQGDSSNSTIQYGNTDLQIKNPINDQTKYACILIQNVNKSGSVEVTDGYGGPASGSMAAIIVESSYGISLRGGQYVMQNLASVIGISSTSATGLVIDRTIFLECQSTGVSLANCVGSDIRPILKNNFTVGGAAVQVSGTSTANYLQPAISGSSTGFSLGIQVVGTADARNEYNCSLLDSSAVSGGSANKLVRNAVQITSTGLSGTNLVSGVMT